jgi:drug/metabolite transporter (DMT)-like permease
VDRDRLTTNAQLALGMITFGSATPISKIVTATIPVFVGSFLRVALGALCLAPIALRHRGEIRSISRGDWIRIGVIALFGMFGFTALMLVGMKMVSGVVGAILMSTAPALTATSSMLFLGDQPTWRKLLAVVLAVAGVLILHLGSEEGGGGDQRLLGSALVLGAVGCEVVYSLVGKAVSERVDPILVAFLAGALALPFFVPFALAEWSGFAPREVDLRSWVALAWYGAGTLALGTWLWYTGIRKAEGTVAAGFMGLMPASALVLSYVLLGEPFEGIHLAGFAVVVAGVLLISWEHARMSEE